MRLTDLNPRWFCVERGGERVGLTFDCPHCFPGPSVAISGQPRREQRLEVPFHHHGAGLIEDAAIRAHFSGEPDRYIWDLAGQEDFESLTLWPSIDASKSGHWHGFIANGEIR